MFLYKLGRFLQVAGMILLPLAIAGNVADETRMPLKTSLLLSAIGVGVFALGWLLQQSGQVETIIGRAHDRQQVLRHTPDTSWLSSSCKLRRYRPGN